MTTTSQAVNDVRIVRLANYVAPASGGLRTALRQLGAGYLAVNWEAFPDEVAQFIQPHPSLSETFGETMLALTGRGLHVG